MKMRVILSLAAGLVVAISTAEAEEKAQRPPAIVLDAGHGGKDYGAVIKGRYEKTLSLAIAKKLKKRLESAGHSVRMTREDDSHVALDRRVRSASDGSLFVSLHLNDLGDERMKGITVYSFGKSGQRWTPVFRSLPPLPAPPRAAVQASAELASAVARSLRSRGFEAAAPERGEYYVLKNPSSPSILIEMGCLSNPEEAARLGDAGYQDRLAEALSLSLREYLAQQNTAVATARTVREPVNTDRLAQARGAEAPDRLKPQTALISHKK